MNSPPILREIHGINTYNNSSFIKEDHIRHIHPNDPTRVAIFPAEKNRGTNFEPFHVQLSHQHIDANAAAAIAAFSSYLPYSEMGPIHQDLGHVAQGK
jgi:hypothetical protein